jgi:hypothetical protein
MATTLIASPPPTPAAGIAAPDTSGVSWMIATDWRRRRDLSKLVQVVLAQAEQLGLIGSVRQG